MAFGATLRGTPARRGCTGAPPKSGPSPPGCRHIARVPEAAAYPAGGERGVNSLAPGERGGRGRGSPVKPLPPGGVLFLVPRSSERVAGTEGRSSLQPARLVVSLVLGCGRLLTAMPPSTRGRLVTPHLAPPVSQRGVYAPPAGLGRGATHLKGTRWPRGLGALQAWGVLVATLRPRRHGV